MIGGIHLSWADAGAIAVILGAFGTMVLWVGKYFFQTKDGCSLVQKDCSSNICSKIDVLRSDLVKMDDRRQQAKDQHNVHLNHINIQLASISQFIKDHEEVHKSDSRRKTT